MRPGERSRSALVLLVFAIVFSALEIGSYTQKSATADEPRHLTDGYTELVLGDYRLDPEQPPLLRMWAALPLRFMGGIRLNIRTQVWVEGLPQAFSHQFLYEDNDADRLLYRARFMTVLLGILLGTFVYGWARELFGFPTAVAVLALYCLEPNILAHAGLVTTDCGLTCFVFGAVWFLWRTTRRFNLGNIAGLTVCVALAQMSKYSALLLWPVLVALLALDCRNGKQPRPRALRAAALVALLAAATMLGIWAEYRFRFAPTPAGLAVAKFQSTAAMQQTAPVTTAIMDWINDHRLLPNGYGNGFAVNRVLMNGRTAFLAGRLSDTGWWYYFPIAFLIKVPLTVLVLFGLSVCWSGKRWNGPLQARAYLLVPPLVFMAAAMAAGFDIGFRHVLPIVPFLLVACGNAISQLRQRVRPSLLAALAAVCLVELVPVYPDYLAFFNGLVGGPRNGYKYLADSNLDWGQDLKGLKQWMDANGVGWINLSYFGQADPKYYGIECLPLAGSPAFQKGARLAVLPGYVAVSVQNLQVIQHDFYAPLLRQKPVAVIGHSIRIYWVDHPWW